MAVDAQKPVRGPADYEWPAEETISCPFPFYEALREQAPVYKYPGRNEFLVSRWEDVCFVSRNTEIFSNAMTAESDPGLMRSQESRISGDSAESLYTPMTMAGSDPPEHKLKRTLGLKVLKEQRPVELIQSKVDMLIDGFIERGRCDFSAEFADLLPVEVIVDILGLPAKDTELFRHWSNSEGAGVRYISEEQLQEEEAKGREGMAYIQRELLDRRDNPRRDGLSDLVHAQIEEHGTFDLDYLTSETWVLLFAGNVTTAHMIASAMLLLLENPEQMDRVRADHDAISAMLDETLRLQSPVQWRQRLVRKDTELGGVKLPAGSTVIQMYGSANRDPERFEDPEEFRVDRPEATKYHLGFGFGIHRCLGAPLAKLEGEIAFRTLFERLGEIRLDSEESDLRAIHSVHLRAPRKVGITFERA